MFNKDKLLKKGQKMEKTKNDFNMRIELEILQKINNFLDSKSKAELILLSKKAIASELKISVVSFDKYLKKIVELSNKNK